jgi:hypothetical protein
VRALGGRGSRPIGTSTMHARTDGPTWCPAGASPRPTPRPQRAHRGGGTGGCLSPTTRPGPRRRRTSTRPQRKTNKTPLCGSRPAVPNSRTSSAATEPQGVTPRQRAHPGAGHTPIRAQRSRYGTARHIRLSSPTRAPCSWRERDLSHNLNQERRAHSRASRLSRVPCPLGYLGVCKCPFAHNPGGGARRLTCPPTRLGAPYCTCEVPP